METKGNDGPWSTCSYEASVTAPISPHVVNCASVVPSKFIRISVGVESYLALDEVKVLGFPGRTFVFCDF